MHCLATCNNPPNIRKVISGLTKPFSDRFFGVINIFLSDLTLKHGVYPPC